MATMEEKEIAKQWQPGTRVELIPDPGEGLGDAIGFMNTKLKELGRTDLMFRHHEVYAHPNGNFYFMLMAAKIGPAV